MAPTEPRRRLRGAARRMVDEDEPALAPRSEDVGRDVNSEGQAKRRRTSAASSKGARVTERPAPPTPPSSATRRRQNALAGSSTGSPVSPKLLVKLDGRVYRPPSPGDPRTRLEFEADLLLAGPPETVDDLEHSRREKRRRQVEGEMRRERANAATQSATSAEGKGKGRLLTFDSGDELDVVKPSTPTHARTRCAVTPPPQPAFPTGATSPSPSLGFPFALQPSPRRAAVPLPPALASLLALHSAVERALILHLSTSGSSLASTLSDVSPSSTATVRMTNLVDLPTLSRMLESTGKRFGEEELRRLVWAWQGADPVDARRAAPGDGDEVGGMGFVVTRARTAAAPGRVAQTYGLGISVVLRANPQLPKFELVSPGRDARRDAPPSPSSVGKGREGMSIVALWTQGKEARRVEVEKRLRAWSERQVKREDDLVDDGDLVFTSSTSGIPLAALPLLAPAVTAIPSTSTPSPTKRPATPARLGAPADLPVASPSDFIDALLQGTPIKSKGGNAADRAAARRERIQAKQVARQQSAYHSSFSALSTGESSPSKRSLKRHGDPSTSSASEDGALSPFEQHKHNAMLSRIGNVADVVSMRCAGRPTPLEEVCTAVANSPLLAIGFDEASHAISFLAAQFPDFCYLKLVGPEQWVYLRGARKAVEVKERVREELARAQEAQKRAGV